MVKKNYMVPETATEQFLRPIIGILSDMTGPGGNDPSNIQDGDFHTAPKKRVF